MLVFEIEVLIFLCIILILIIILKGYFWWIFYVLNMRFEECIYSMLIKYYIKYIYFINMFGDGLKLYMCFCKCCMIYFKRGVIKV